MLQFIGLFSFVNRQRNHMLYLKKDFPCPWLSNFGSLRRFLVPQPFLIILKQEYT